MFKNKKYTHRKYIFPMFKNIYKEEYMTNLMIMKCFPQKLVRLERKGKDNFNLICLKCVKKRLVKLERKEKTKPT